jgi:hypothetical protein
VDGLGTVVQPYLKLSLAPNLTFCVVGSTADEPNPLAGPKLQIRSEIPSIQQVLDQLASNDDDDDDRNKCTRTIVLSHAGIAVDEELLEQLKGTIDVLLGGHSHVLTPASRHSPEAPEFGVVVPNASSNHRLVHTGANGRYVGLVRLEWESSSSLNTQPPHVQTELLPLDVRHGVQPDADFERWQTQLFGNHLDRHNGDPTHSRMHMHMEGSGSICAQVCRSGDCLLGNVVADAMRACVEHGPCQPENGAAATGPVVALLESGTLRNCLLSTHSDFSAILPWPNRLVVMQLNGGTIRKMIQHGIKSPTGGGFLQVSGLEYRYSNGTVHEVSVSRERTSKPISSTAFRRAMPQFSFQTSQDEYASKAQHQKESCQVSAHRTVALVQDTIYSVVVTDWLVAGGDGFGPFPSEAETFRTNVSLHDAIFDHATSSAPPFRSMYRSVKAPVTFSVATKSGISGFLGGAAAFLLTYPIYTMFVRRSMGKSLVCTYDRLFDGAFLGTLATALSNSIFFMVYSSSSLLQFSAFFRSSVAAFTNSVATSPFWVIVTHLQLLTSPVPFMDVAKAIYKDKGLKGFFTGISLNLLMCVYPVVRQLSLELIVDTFGLSGGTHVAIAAAIGSLVATVVTFPIQKWRILLQSGEQAPKVDGLWHFYCDGLIFKLLDTSFKTFTLFLVKEQSDVMLCILEG